MGAVLENELKVDLVLDKAVDVPGHPPQVQDEQSHSSKHRKHVSHRANLRVILLELNDIQDQQEDQRQKDHHTQSYVKPKQKVIFNRHLLLCDLSVVMQV